MPRLSELGEYVDIPELDTKEWAPFHLEEIGDVTSGRDIYAAERIDGHTPYITSGGTNNGVGYFVGNENDTLDSGYIALNRNGAVGKAFYHPSKSLMGNDCRKVHLKKADGNLYVGQFIALCISMQSGCFSYSRKLGTARAKRMQIMLPITDSGEPDYDYMEQYVKNMMLRKYRAYLDFIEQQSASIERERVSDALASLAEKSWREFSLDDIFTVKAGKRLETRNKIPGARPFIGATDNGNGVTGFVGNDNASRDCNVLGVNYNGAPCIAFYHPYECLFTDDVKRLHLREHGDNKFALLFFVSVFAQQRSKYSYGYKFKEQRMLRQKLMLPVDDSGNPDYEYMEQYARKLMLRKRGQYLAYLGC